ncbi:MAG: peptide-methionine (S)-S-oxide reductase MsrA [Cellvibrionaceae bacterium]|nr:peptide-methionine (S)-S-oxide reductase MsrA [Cellvibrionaceae bacterium]
MTFLDKFNARVAQKISMVEPASALPGRDKPVKTAARHFVSQRALQPPFAQHLEQVIFGMGCFWGAEKVFWALEGVEVTAVGYSGGYTANPSYEEVCTGKTGHNEVVLVVYDPKVLSFAKLLGYFWESHNPTQGMRQGNDLGTQYRSGIYYCSENQKIAAQQSLQVYQQRLTEHGHGAISTEIVAAGEFYYAEDYHQQYLAKNPNGYCGLGGVGVCLDNRQGS